MQLHNLHGDKKKKKIKRIMVLNHKKKKIASENHVKKYIQEKKMFTLREKKSGELFFLEKKKV